MAVEPRSQSGSTPKNIEITKNGQLQCVPRPQKPLEPTKPQRRHARQIRLRRAIDKGIRLVVGYTWTWASLGSATALVRMELSS